jgi:hypothetical protein
MRTKPLSNVATATIAESGTKSTAIDIRDYKSGMVNFPAEFSTDTITFEHCDTVDGTYAVFDVTVTMTAVTGWMALPAALFSGFFIKVVTNTGVAAAATLNFVFKS